MIQRIIIDKWVSDHSFKLIHTSRATKSITTYLPSMGFEDSIWVKEKCEKLGLKGSPDLVKIALCAGAYSRLWIGEMDGLIAPMDIPPEGWTYPSQKPVEASWFWTPSKTAEVILLHELEEANPLMSQQRHFKSLVPFQLQRRHGAIAQVNGIDLIRLPDLVRPGVPFLFEIEV